MTPPPRRPTPITVAGVLLLVAATAVQLLATAADVILTGVPMLLTLPALLPCGFLAVMGDLLLRAKLPGVMRLAAWLTNLGILAATPAVVGLMVGIEGALSPTGLSFNKTLMLGGVGLLFTSAVAVVIASIALQVHAEEYTRWREKLRQWEAETAWELVDE